MNKILTSILVLFHTMWFWFSFFILLVLFFIPFIIFIFLPDSIRYRSKKVFYVIDLFYWLCLKCFLLPVSYKGLENIPDEPSIFVANHQSSLDIPLLGHLAHGNPHVWLALSNLMTHPLLRFILPCFTVLVDLSSARKAVTSLHITYDLVKDKDCHIMIFPEGGRYTDGTVHEFFRGFALLAQRTKRAVVPVYIKGAAQAYSPHSIFIHYHPITVTIGEPIMILPDETDREFKNRVFTWFLGQQAGECI